MILVPLSGVTGISFCQSDSQFILGAHSDEDSSCSHEHHSDSDCPAGPIPCEESHSEVSFGEDTFVQAQILSLGIAPILAEATRTDVPHSYRGSQTRLPRLARPPPDLPVYLRLGVMRL